MARWTHVFTRSLTVSTSCAALAAAFLYSPAHAVTPDATARTIALHGKAWAGSSVNVLANTRQSLFTDSVHQYAAWYGADGRLMLAKRRLGHDRWEVRPSQYKGKVKDAHNHVSLAVDGAGVLHVAFDHHNTPLRYARATALGSLKLGALAPMVGTQEGSVTYPQLLRMPDGGLVFQYRDGGSGDGRLVLNRYDVKAKGWQRVHDNLIDGERQRSAYWDTTVDQKGTLHMAWTWRETPDVATNHDLAYARSQDGGVTWTGLDGKALSLPITQASAPYALKIPQQSNLMNPPAVGADNAGRPYIAGYWSPAPGAKPRYHVLHADGGQWRVIAGPESAQTFTLAGTDTKFPPISRPALLVENDWRKTRVGLLYRNAEGRVAVSHIEDLANPVWTTLTLTRDSVGAWEPSVDPVLWSRLGQAHMLAQRVAQNDGDDRRAKAAAGALDVLIWSPNWERHQALHPTPEQAPPANLDAPLSRDAIAATVQKVADWQWANLPVTRREYHLNSWTIAPFYIGQLAASRKMPTRDFESRVIATAEKLAWQPDERIYHADDHAVMQAYLWLYLKHRDPKMIAPTKARLDHILANQPTTPLDWGAPGNQDRWSWSDALFMGPMSWLLMHDVTGDKRYLDYMNREWWATSDRLYRSDIGLFFRDEAYLDLRERNGKTIHWARGTGWSVAGLAQVLERFPKSHPDYPRYVKQFKEMAAAYLKAQQPDGLWRPGVLDPKTHTARETSGSAFATYALAWGVNHKLLDAKRYGPAVIRAWNSLTASVTPEGKLEDVQPIGHAPHGFDPHNSEPFATGAFLLAASEVYGMAKR